jgi:UDP-N-acetylglucosamine--dolichyl-phosphate N-acetylglucosaminephosphotransferase
MIEIIAIISVASFLATLLAIPRFMKFLKSANIMGIDQQKKNKPLIPSSGGLPVAFGLLGGLMLFIAIDTFLFKSSASITVLLAASSTILIVTLVGILDDINIRQVMNKDATGTLEYRVGLRQWVKPVLTLPAAVPLMVVSAGQSMITLPILGIVDVGIVYPLIIVPVAVVVVSNVNNMLAGMNGLEAGLGFIASLSLGIYAFLFNRVEGFILSFILAAALLAFLVYNKYPARLLPGDSLTYLIGATFVTAVILGDVELFAIFVYTPWIIEALLKLRKKFAASSLGILQEDGTLKAPYKKIYSLTHVVMKAGRFTEKQVTWILYGLEAIICLLAFIVFL